MKHKLAMPLAGIESEIRPLANQGALAVSRRLEFAYWNLLRHPNTQRLVQFAFIFWIKVNP